MEIIKQGDKTYKCNICGTEMRINKISDLRHGIVGRYDGLFFSEAIYGDYILCPRCGNKIVISIDD